jgi:glycosyltransferase involved in cell wall biosynthesis
MKEIEISIVSPVYQAEKIVDELVRRIGESVSAITDRYEIILVEDGSRDESWKAIMEACRKNSRVKGIKLSRNFGQHYALTAGIESAQGDYVVIMDCDLQDNPKYIAAMLEKCRAGYDIVYTSKTTRKHSGFKNIAASVYFRLFNYLSENQMATDDVGSFSMISRKAADAFLAIREFHRHYLMVLRLLGFNFTVIKIEHEKRFEGKSSYTFKKLIAHGINGITSQSDKLLRISVNIGFGFFVVSLIWAAIILARYFLIGSLPGYTSMMVLMLLSTGLILMSIGVAGIYIGKIFEQVKGRPLYFIDQKINF